jgi:hypothetical protein
LKPWLKHAQFEIVSMLASNLAAGTRREYAHDMRDLLNYHAREGHAVCFSSNWRVVRNGEETIAAMPHA